MRGVARLGDKTIGRCTCHKDPIENMPGHIVSASPDTYADHLGVARLGDIILADCGHTAKIITSSSVSFANQLGVARLGDLGGGACYTCKIITASSDQVTN